MKTVKTASAHGQGFLGRYRNDWTRFELVLRQNPVNNVITKENVKTTLKYNPLYISEHREIKTLKSQIQVNSLVKFY